MLTVVRLQWDAVDEQEWRLLRALLSTERLAPHGCMSSHIRRTGRAIQVNALWDDMYGARLFCQGPLQDVVARTGSEAPAVSQLPLRGLFTSGQRPVAPASAAVRTAPESVPTPRAA